MSWIKRVSLFVLCLLVAVQLGSAQPVDEPYQNFHYKQLEMVKEPDNFIAGGRTNMTLFFKNADDNMGPLVAELEIIDTEGRDITKDNFEVDAHLESTSRYPIPEGNSPEYNVYDFTCADQGDGSFYCYNLSKFAVTCNASDICEGQATYVSLPVLPKSNNNLTFNIVSNPALVPSAYEFSPKLYKKWTIPEIEDPIKQEVEKGEEALFDASPSDVKLWITTSESKVLELDAILNKFSLQMQYPPGDKEAIKSIEMEINDSLEQARMRIFYEQGAVSEDREDSLAIYYFNESKFIELTENEGLSVDQAIEQSWQPLASEVNGDQNYVEATTSHLSLYGLFAAPKTETEQVYTSGGGDYDPPCEENWTCTDWSRCVAGLQVRTCTDQNECGTTENKPAIERECTMPEEEDEAVGEECNPQWTCSDWSECTDGTRERTCYDLQNCGRSEGRPVEVMGCQGCEPNWVCTPWSDCTFSTHNRTCVDWNNCAQNEKKLPQRVETENCAVEPEPTTAGNETDTSAPFGGAIVANESNICWGLLLLAVVAIGYIWWRD